MAKTYDMDIDGYIGSWLYSKRYVKNALKELGEKKISVRVNSAGGIVDDAIDIASRFEAHGNVICELHSWNASAATVLTPGAKKVRAHENACCFIHKVLSRVDEWGYMNEDDIEAVIKRPETPKDSNSAQTLILAGMYAKKSGKPVKDILNLMKAEKCLNAKEAKEWGFVDEIFEDAQIKPASVQDPALPNLFNAAGLPVPPLRAAGTPDREHGDAGRMQGFPNGLREIVNPQKNTVTVNRTYISINTPLGVEGIEFKNGKAELSEEQVKTLNDALNSKAGEKPSGEKPSGEKPAEKDDKSGEKDDKPAGDELSNKLQAEIKALKEQIETPNRQPGAETQNVSKATDTPLAENDETKELEEARNFPRTASVRETLCTFGLKI